MNFFKKLFLVILIFLNNECKKPNEIESINRSKREDIDLYLIPNKFNILETKWLSTRYDSHFDKKDLIENLQKYGRTIADLKNNPEYNFREKDSVITLNVGKTSHSTAYDYDTNIPIIFYGKKFFLEKEFKEEIHQQNIVPTLAKILKIRNPNGVETKSLNETLKPSWSENLPEMIVTVVIDQGGQQLYSAHRDTPVFINQLKKSSSYFPNAKVGHLDAHTAVGHAAIGTGAYPNKSSVVGNSFFRIKDGKFFKSEIYALEDKKVEPTELLTETLADVFDHEHKNESEVVSQCYALRASIGMAGHGSFPIPNSNYVGDKDFVYWLSSSEVSWITDNRYYSLPQNSSRFSPLTYFQTHHKEGWAGLKLTSKEEATKSWPVLMASPSEVKMETDTFINAIETEIIAKKKNLDQHTDFAYLTLKASDAAGHQFGWESIEAKETFKEIDNNVKKIYEFLEKNYGDKFILIITADHGCAPLPEISGGSRLTIEDFFEQINSLLPKDRDKNKSLIKFMTVAQISLDKEVMKEFNISEEKIKEKILSIKVDNKLFFKKLYTKKDL